MSNAKVAIESDKQGRFRKLSILNYNKRIGYGQSEKS
jgi:hypothetical protein